MLRYLVVIVEEFIVMKLNGPLTEIWNKSANGKVRFVLLMVPALSLGGPADQLNERDSLNFEPPPFFFWHRLIRILVTATLLLDQSRCNEA